MEKYEEFHRYPPKKIGEFEKGFAIPSHVFRVGKAKAVMYRSGKIDPATLQKPRHPVDYIHEHDAGVETFLVHAHPAAYGSERVTVPEEFVHAKALCKLGEFLGMIFVTDDEEEDELQGTRPLPELYAVPSGKCLVVVQSKRHVIAMSWGGALGVHPRGIDG